VFACTVTGQLRPGIVPASQLSAGIGSTTTDHQAGPVCRSVLEHAALPAALDRRWCMAGGLGWATLA